ncbi:MAG: T9SS type A sorting domain-containing protein [Crocinitomicaceae bacterium]
MGGSSFYNGHYRISPGNDTVVLGNSYLNLGISYSNRPFAFRQEGNKLMGVVHDSISEYLIMDFDAQVNDTIHNLYSEGSFYDAQVLAKDSVIMNNGEYHHFVNLMGIRYMTQNGNWQDSYWELTWNERGLCSSNSVWGGAALGGFFYNTPEYFNSVPGSYSGPEFCTTDPRYISPPNVSCDNCTPSTNDIPELTGQQFQIKPNPVTDKFSISNAIFDFDEIEITNIHGKAVFHQSVHLFDQIDISSLAPGTYFIEISSKTNSSRIKILKQ